MCMRCMCRQMSLLSARLPAAVPMGLPIENDLQQSRVIRSRRDLLQVGDVEGEGVRCEVHPEVRDKLQLWRHRDGDATYEREECYEQLKQHSREAHYLLPGPVRRTIHRNASHTILGTSIEKHNTHCIPIPALCALPTCRSMLSPLISSLFPLRHEYTSRGTKVCSRQSPCDSGCQW
jgi:hypothetical protein